MARRIDLQQFWGLAVNDQLSERFRRSNTLFADLLGAIDPAALGSRLGSLPSNTIGQQYWCVVGARESYLAAARAGHWQGFSCSLTASDLEAPAVVVARLEETTAALASYLEERSPLAGAPLDLLLDLLEHETQHHGQLIRYIYALGLAIPESWRARYALS